MLNNGIIYNGSPIFNYTAPTQECGRRLQGYTTTASSSSDYNNQGYATASSSSDYNN